MQNVRRAANDDKRAYISTEMLNKVNATLSPGATGAEQIAKSGWNGEYLIVNLSRVDGFVGSDVPVKPTERDIALVIAPTVAIDVPDISGQWHGKDWDQIMLAQTTPGEFAGTYTHTVGQTSVSGKINLKQSRTPRRFNGTWREGDDGFGTLSVLVVDNEIRGALTTDRKSKINPATPRLTDLTWARAGTTTNAPDGASPQKSELGKLLARWKERRSAISTASIEARLFRPGRSVNQQLSAKDIEALAQEYGKTKDPTRALESLIRGLRPESPKNGPLWDVVSFATDGKRTAQRSIDHWVRDARANVHEFPLGDQHDQVMVWSASTRYASQLDLADFASELPPVNELQFTGDENGVSTLRFATSELKIKMNVDDKTGLVRHITRSCNDQLRSEVYQLGVLRCQDDIVFPAVALRVGYTAGRLTDAEVLSPISIKINEALPDDTFKVARRKGSTAVDFRHDAQGRLVNITEDTPDVVAYLLARDSSAASGRSVSRGFSHAGGNSLHCASSQPSCENARKSRTGCGTSEKPQAEEMKEPASNLVPAAGESEKLPGTVPESVPGTVSSPQSQNPADAFQARWFSAMMTAPPESRGRPMKMSPEEIARLRGCPRSNKRRR